MRKIFKIVFIFVLLFLNVIPCKADNISVTDYSQGTAPSIA